MRAHPSRGLGIKADTHFRIEYPHFTGWLRVSSKAGAARHWPFKRRTFRETVLATAFSNSLFA
jgi:hypothetical protein